MLTGERIFLSLLFLLKTQEEDDFMKIERNIEENVGKTSGAAKYVGPS